MIIKFLAKGAAGDPTSYWRRFLPEGNTRIGDVEFVFSADCERYDWLVVYDDLPASGNERFPSYEEILKCPREKTLFITGEPSTIKVYGNKFLEQFGHILTSQEPWALKHPSIIRSQCGLLWFYGKEFKEAAVDFPIDKPFEISTVCSAKQQTHTLHSLRYEFTQKLKAVMPQLEIFGHGHRFIQRKVEALDPYKYHLAVENHVASHHWTEKLADTFLGGCLPFYHGCPNVYEYFPEESLIQIDIRDQPRAIAQIREAVNNGEYEKRISAIRESRRLVLEKYSTFPLIARLVTEMDKQVSSLSNHGSILSRRLWRKRHPLATIAYGVERLKVSRKAQHERLSYLAELEE